MTRILLLCSLFASFVAVLAPSAQAETVPYSYCSNSSCNAVVRPLNWPCRTQSRTCDRDIQFTQISDGVPEPITGTDWECLNCPTVDGNPCTANDPGGTAKVCRVVSTATETLTTEVSVTGGPNVDVLLWKVQFEIHIGRSMTETVSQQFEDEVTAAHCRVLKGHGDFVKVVDAQLRMDIVHSQTTVYSGPAWCAGQQPPRMCNRSKVIVEYDSNFYGASLSTDENNSCAYEFGDGQ